MPYPNEHAARLKDPAKYSRFRRDNNKFGPGIHAIWGITKAGKVELQAIRFDASKFSVAAAKKWLKEHGYKPILFEPASGKSKSGFGGDMVISIIEGNGIQIQAGADDQKPISVLILAYTGGLLRLAGMREKVLIDMAGMDLPEQVLLCADHITTVNNILGYGHANAVDGQLLIEGKIHPIGAVNQRIIGLSKAGVKFQASIGAEYISGRTLAAGEKVKVNGREFAAKENDEIMLVTRSRLKEVSILGLGADDKTQVSIAATAAKLIEEDIMDKEKEKDKIEAGEATLQAGGETNPVSSFGDGEGDKPKPEVKEDAKDIQAKVVADLRARFAAEQKRIAEIQKVCGKNAELAGKAIEAGWSVEKTELELLRAQRPQAPAGIVKSSDIPEGRILEAALCMKFNIGDSQFLEKVYGAETLNKADEFRSVPFSRIMEVLALRAGVSVPLNTRSAEFMRAAFSTSELSGIVGAVANKALAAGFEAAPSVVPQICAKRSHANFHTHTVYSLALSGDLEEVAPDGELKHLKLGEESWTRQVKTRGAILRITRTDIVNDELGAFADNAKRLGRKGSVAREKAFFTLLNATGAGSSFFTSARNNYFDGADSALGIDALNTAVRLFRDQTGPDDDPVSIEPKLLLVPTNVEATAKALMNDQFVVVTGQTTSRKVEPRSLGVWAGAFNPVTSPWLSNSNLSGYSTTAWYLLADPSDVPVAEIAYLNGQETPTVEYFGLDSDPATLGVTWRVYYDFGAALAEYRAGVKSKGAA